MQIVAQPINDDRKIFNGKNVVFYKILISILTDNHFWDSKFVFWNKLTRHNLTYFIHTMNWPIRKFRRHFLHVTSIFYFTTSDKVNRKKILQQRLQSKSLFCEWSIDCYKPYTYCSIFLMWLLPLLSPPPQFRFPNMLIYICTCIKHTNKEPNMIYITLVMFYSTAILNKKLNTWYLVVSNTNIVIALPDSQQDTILV